MPDEDPDGDLTNFTYNLRFPEQYHDAETGLHYNYFRTYDPSTGRYLESDPIGLNGGLNTYGYAYQNPLGYSDPRGLNPACVPLVVADGPLPVGDAICAGMLLYGAYALGQSMANSTDDDNVIPFPKKEEAEESCEDPDGPDECELLKNQLDVMWVKIT